MSPKKQSDESLGRFLSLVLRHQPQAAYITLDRHGWADIEKLLAGCVRAGKSMDRETLERIVRENSKQRYSLSPDGKKIRANQGHSIPVELELRREGLKHLQIKFLLSTAVIQAQPHIHTGLHKRRKLQE